MEVKNTPVIYFPNHNESASVSPVKAPDQAEQPKTETQIQEKITKEMLMNKINELNDFIEPTSTAVKFKLHEELNTYYVQVIDTISEEVLKEIPNKKFLDMYASRAEFMGLLVDDKL